MRAPRVNATVDALLRPGHEVWAGAEEATLSLSRAPLAMQPSPWMQGAYQGRTWGALTEARLRAVHNGEVVAVRATWQAPDPATSSRGAGAFPDACAVMLPFVPDAPVFMGGEDAWVNLWLWRADGVGPFTLTAAGIGTSERIADGVTRTAADHAEGRWQVVFARPLDPGDGDHHVPLRPGTPWQVSLCVWQGAQGERAGLKSFAPAWTELALEP